MKQTEVLDWAMRGVIEVMRQEKNEEKKVELNQVLRDLAMMHVLELQKERE